jgi:hypothetical protein
MDDCTLHNHVLRRSVLSVSARRPPARSYTRVSSTYTGRRRECAMSQPRPRHASPPSLLPLLVIPPRGRARAARTPACRRAPAAASGVRMRVYAHRRAPGCSREKRPECVPVYAIRIPVSTIVHTLFCFKWYSLLAMYIQTLCLLSARGPPAKTDERLDFPAKAWIHTKRRISASQRRISASTPRLQRECRPSERAQLDVNSHSVSDCLVSPLSRVREARPLGP